MPKAKLTTRERTTSNVSTDNLNKGSELSFAEADSNFINLRDRSWGLADDSSTVLQVTDDKTITIAGGTNVTTALSGDTLTINATGTGSTGDLSIIGSTISAPSNADLTLETAGTGNIAFKGLSVFQETATIASINTNLSKIQTAGSTPTSLQLIADGSGTAGVNDEANNSIYLNSYSGKYYLTKGQQTYCMITTQGGSADAGIQIVGGGETGGIVVDDGAIQLLDTVTGGMTVTGTVSLSGLVYPTSDGTTGQFLQTNGTGGLSFATAPSGIVTALNNQAANRLTTIGATTTELDGEANLTFDGSTLSIANTTTNDSLLITSTEDSSSAAPVITLKRNSGSPADADYLGQLKFKGENDADQEVVYAKITAKISDASDTTEDGLIEFALRKAGSNNIGARLTSTDLKLLNGTGLTSNGNISSEGSITATTSIGNDAVTITDNTITASRSNDNLNLTASGTGKVAISGLQYPNADGSSGQVLQTNGSGVLSFIDAGQAALGDITFTGSTMNSPSNADITLEPSGTGSVVASVDGSSNGFLKVGNGSAFGAVVSNGSDEQLLFSIGDASASKPQILLDKDSNGGDIKVKPKSGGRFNLETATSTTIGSNGSASALTANPVGYVKIKVNGTEYQVPYYNL